MKRLTMNVMIAAAALAAVAGSASAQTLKANIPFTFRAGRALMAPGSYELRASRSGGSFFVLYNSDDHRSAMVASFAPRDTTKEWKADGVPRLAFLCDGARCSLRDIWTGDDAPTYRLIAPKPGLDGDIHIAEIRMTATKAD